MATFAVKPWLEGPLAGLSASNGSEHVPDTIPCSICGQNPISTPPLATPETKFTCRYCSERIWRARMRERVLAQATEPQPYIFRAS